MALYTHAVGLTAAGTLSTPTAVSSSDTISAADVGSRGAVLRVITAGTGTSVTVADPGATASGNPGDPTAVTVGTTAAKMIYIPPSAVDPSTGVATVAYSATTSVTCELYRL